MVVKKNNIPVQEGPVSELMVSVTKHVSDKNPQDRKLIEFLRKTVIEDLAHSAICDKIANETDNDARKELKKTLPCIIVGLILSGGTSMKNAVMRNLLIAFDFDTDDVAKAILIKEYCMSKFKLNAVYIAFSVSRKGVHMVLRIADERKRDYWNTIVATCKQDGFEVDTSTKDETRKLFLGNDKECWINHDAEPIILPEVAVVKKSDVKISMSPEHHMKIILDAAHKSGLKFESGYRHAYILYVASQAIGKGVIKEDAIRILNNVINLSEYEEHLVKLEQLYIEQAGNFGAFLSSSKKNYYTMLVEEIKSTFELRYNVVKGRPEFKKHGVSEWTLISNRWINSIMLDLNSEHNFSCSKEAIKTILHSDRAPDFDPIAEYFKSLPKWDGSTDYIGQLAETVTTDDREFFKTVLTKWLVGAVGTAIHEEVANHIVLILIGSQGIGKTTWLANLCPPELSQYFYSGSIDPKNKDTLVFISECFIIELAEMSNLTRHEHNELKDVITKTAINTRIPYDTYPEKRIRRASFIGSVNDSEPLTDTTGNRRFLCFEVTTIDYSRKVDINGVYAQAYALLNNGYPFYFNPDEVQMLNSRNEAYTQNSIEEDYLLDVCYPGTEARTDEYWSTSKIAECIFKDSGINISQITILRLGKALAKHKFPKVTRNDRKVYRVNLFIRDADHKSEVPSDVPPTKWF